MKKYELVDRNRMSTGDEAMNNPFKMIAPQMLSRKTSEI
jgi:hypothetical protein